MVKQLFRQKIQWTKAQKKHKIQWNIFLSGLKSCQNALPANRSSKRTSETLMLDRNSSICLTVKFNGKATFRTENPLGKSSEKHKIQWNIFLSGLKSCQNALPANRSSKRTSETLMLYRNSSLCLTVKFNGK